MSDSDACVCGYRRDEHNRDDVLHCGQFTTARVLVGTGLVPVRMMTLDEALAMYEHGSKPERDAKAGEK